jgi:hypothetical protein
MSDGHNMFRGILGTALPGCTLLAAAWFNYAVLTEAFGSGPPYYGRTTNMDKWTNPVPAIVAVDLVAVVAALLLWRFAGRRPAPR